MKNIFFIETTDNFPFKFTANNSKVKLLADGLIKAGNRVQIINNLQGSEISSIPYAKGNNQNIQYFTFPLYVPVLYKKNNPASVNIATKRIRSSSSFPSFCTFFIDFTRFFFSL